MARHTALDCFEKRNQRGYLFVLGDETPYPKVKRKEVARVIGDGLQTDIPVEELIAELERTFEVYYVLPKMTHHWNNPLVHRRSVELLGQNTMPLEDPAAICELIASTIGMAEGKVDLKHLADDLREAGTSSAVAQAVKKTLLEVAE